MRLFPTRIYLTGFMAAGKTTIGQRLAKRIGYRFIDLDVEIERQAGAAITEIFASEGEEYFREIETAVLKQTVELRNIVVALGGGALLKEYNRKLASQVGTVVYLHVDEEQLVDRLISNRAERPLAARASAAGGDARQTLAVLLRERLPVYRSADVIVDLTDLRRSAATDAVENCITESLRQ